ncbi:galanin receptor 2a [Electrophorus electricus]|uniref:G-protein coupled receptors family 1 profile domain-containing protein n=1 Tax=Electrophorus electricus TaxID=8005 RepID=A0A4W4FAX4_ELEEL|nr:galanin receptor 2a [Electrophorus electricus]
MNASQQIQFSPNRKVESAIISLVFSVIFLVGTVGNCLVLAVLFRNGQTNAKTTNMFILNLGLADLCFIVFCVPLQATIYAMDEWVFGPFVCKAVHFVIYLTMYASIFTLAAVSLDRYLAIRYPLRARETRTPRNALISIGVVWTLSLVFSSPYLSYYQQMDLDGTIVCIPAWDFQHRRAMDVCTFVFGYLIPVLILSLTYARTIRHLWTSVDPMEDMYESQRAKRKVTKMIIIVAVLFCLCWLPHHLVILCMWFGRFPLNHTTYVLRILSHLVAYTNSCLNPIVYALVSKHFRKGFRKVFGCVMQKRPVNRVHVAPQGQTVSLVEVGSSDTSNQGEGLGRVRFWNKKGRRRMTGTFMTFNVT